MCSPVYNIILVALDLNILTIVTMTNLYASNLILKTYYYLLK